MDLIILILIFRVNDNAKSLSSFIALASPWTVRGRYLNKLTFPASYRFWYLFPAWSCFSHSLRRTSGTCTRAKNNYPLYSKIIKPKQERYTKLDEAVS